MNIVGINISHDTSVCLMQDGEIIFYIEEERLCKEKSYEITDLNFCIQSLEIIKQYTNKIDYLTISTFRRVPINYINSDVLISESIITQILNLGISIDQIILDFDKHHMHHGYNAFYSSGLDEAVVLVTDGSGSYPDGLFLNGHQCREIESIYKFKNNSHETVFKHYSSNNLDIDNKLEYKVINSQGDIISNSFSCGAIYSFVTEYFLGLSHLDKGKTMGMSSYGTLEKEKVEWFHQYNNNYLFDCNVFRLIARSKIYLSASFQEQADFAKKLQYETKQYCIKLIQKAIDLSNSNNVILSGGYFQNCVNNYAYLKAFPKINFYVDPICYDGGTAIGACFYVWHHILKHPNKMQKFNNLYLGPTYSVAF